MMNPVGHTKSHGPEMATAQNLQDLLDMGMKEKLGIEVDSILALRDHDKYKRYLEKVKAMFERKFSYPENRYAARIELLLSAVLTRAGYAHVPWKEMNSRLQTKMKGFFAQPVTYLDIQMWQEDGEFFFKVLDSDDPSRVQRLCSEFMKECYAYCSEDYHQCFIHLELSYENVVDKLKIAIEKIIGFPPSEWAGSSAMATLVEKLSSSVEVHFTPMHKMHISSCGKNVAITGTRTTHKLMRGQGLCRNFELCFGILQEAHTKGRDAESKDLCVKCYNKVVHIIAVCKGEDDTMFTRSNLAPKDLTYENIWKTLTWTTWSKKVVSICSLELVKGTLVDIIQRRAVISLYLQFERMARGIKNVTVRASFKFTNGSRFIDQVIEYAQTRGLLINLEATTSYPDPVHFIFFDNVPKALPSIYEFTWEKWCYIGEKSEHLNMANHYAECHNNPARDGTAAGKKLIELRNLGLLKHGEMMPCTTVAYSILNKGATNYIVEATWEIARLLQSSSLEPPEFRLECGNLRFNLKDECIRKLKGIDWLPEINAVLGQQINKKVTFEILPQHDFLIGRVFEKSDPIPTEMIILTD